MIKANELRIGNWVSDGEIEYQIESKDIYHLSVRVYGTVCNGIPITPEWLERLGFAGGIDFLLIKNGFTICFEKKGELLFCYLEAVGVEILYVHQLQNLYFALTGEELQLINKE